ncbi:metallophosphoesterase [Chitinophagaceae bacterium 26-R-25]|nr:metallophosphoesterase [Chitinophagaceae bacterium 26-R-25]
MADKFSSSPDKTAINQSLDALLKEIRAGHSQKGLRLNVDLNSGKYIVLSDQHKGARDAADDFLACEKNYVAALDYYFKNNFTLVGLGDCEELWENKPIDVLRSYRDDLLLELNFLKDDRFVKIFGNHDLEWSFKVPQSLFLKKRYGKQLRIYEGLLLNMEYKNEVFSIFMAHGHQGDQRSDGNAFSKWFVAAIWTPVQRFLEIKTNTLSDNFELVDKHNIMMYEWSAEQKNLLFISGHTHKPVFASLDHIERINVAIEQAKSSNNAELVTKLEAELAKRQGEYAGKQSHKTMAIPSYFNSGCCCFSDGDITGIEIENGEIRLVKWKETGHQPQRLVLEYSSLSYIFDELGTGK